MSALEKVPTGMRTSRRNLIKIGAIGGSAIFARLTTARQAAAANPNPNQGPGQNPNQGPGQNQCFLKGTTIRTAAGDRKIEDLAMGDLLPTVFGGICPIQWIGRYSLKKRSDQGMGREGAAGSGRSISAWYRCSACRFVCHEGTRTARRWRSDDRGQPDQRHDDYGLRSARA